MVQNRSPLAQFVFFLRMSRFQCPLLPLPSAPFIPCNAHYSIILIHSVLHTSYITPAVSPSGGGRNISVILDEDPEEQHGTERYTEVRGFKLLQAHATILHSRKLGR